MPNLQKLWSNNKGEGVISIIDQIEKKVEMEIENLKDENITLKNKLIETSAAHE
jgi:hypothetical protein